jgi:alpha-L-rhamnosidase
MNRTTFLLVALHACAWSGIAGAASVNGLRCEYQKEPLGLDVARPRLSWIMNSDGRGDFQSAYQVLVASTPEKLSLGQGNLWDSGRVESSDSIYVPYSGVPLESRARCYWKVRVWDKGGKASPWSAASFWTMGLLKPEDWKAYWITASRWFVPRTLRPKGFETPPSDSPDMYAWADVDLGASLVADAVQLYSPEAASFPVRFKIEGSDTLDFDRAKIIADWSATDYHMAGGGPQDFAGHGIRARYVRLTIIRSPETAPGSRKYRSTVRQMAVVSGGRNVALMRPTREFGTAWNSGHATFMVDGMPSSNEGNTCPNDACPITAAPLLRKSFRVDRAVRRATLYVAALGMADVTINGQRVGDDVLSPPFTDYTKQTVYLTRDITALLGRGENVVGATLGNAFFSTPGRGFGERHSGHGPPRLLAQIDIESTDGRRQTIVTDETWKWALSEITFNDIWLGYREDRTLAKPGWDRPGYRDSGWRAVSLTQGLGGALRSRIGPPVRVVGELKPIRVEGNRAFFDVLTAGWPSVRVVGKTGQTLTISGRCAKDYNLPEMSFKLASDGPAVLEPRFLVLSGPLELKVDGLSEPLTRASVSIRIVHADLQSAGTFHSSNPWLNQLHEVVLRTHLNYNLDHPLDPMREKQGWTQDAQNMFETAAYLTDVAALYRKWWRDWADAQQPDGLLGSVVPVVGRQIHDWNCPWWSGVIVLLPWQHYLYYGDRRFLEEAYEPMRRYVDYLGFLAGTGAGRRPLDYPDPRRDVDADAARRKMLIWIGAGDWLNPSRSGSSEVSAQTPLLVGAGDWRNPSAPGPNNALPGAMTAMPAWSYYAGIVSKTAMLLGKPDEAASYAAVAKDVADRYNAVFFQADTGIYGDRADQQTAMVLPFALGIAPEDRSELVLARLIDAIHARHDHVGVGFVGLPFLMETLTEVRRADLANRIVNQHDFPSWATLMHDGVLAEDWQGGGAQMPSCGGAVGMWLYQSVLGIRPDPAGPGFRKFILAPQPDVATGLTSARGSYQSVHGKIESEWTYADRQFTLRAVVPANTRATIYVPAEAAETVTESGRPAAQSDGVRFLRMERDAAVYEVGSGAYVFRAHWVPR